MDTDRFRCTRRIEYDLDIWCRQGSVLVADAISRRSDSVHSMIEEPANFVGLVQYLRTKNLLEGQLGEEVWKKQRTCSLNATAYLSASLTAKIRWSLLWNCGVSESFGSPGLGSRKVATSSTTASEPGQVARLEHRVSGTQVTDSDSLTVIHDRVARDFWERKTGKKIPGAIYAIGRKLV